MKKTSNMKASNMKRVLLTLALLAGLSTMSYAQTYREITNTKLIINSSYPSGNALTLRTGAGQAAYTLTLPASAPANGDILRVDPSTANTLIWTSPLDMYVFENGLTESGTNTVKWGGALTGATIINTAGSNAITFYNNTAASTAAMTIGGGAGTLTLDVRGGTTINTSGTANTSIGNATGTFELNSAALDVSTAGAISGVTTINMSGALTNTGISNQIVLGTGTTVTLTAPTPAANAVYTIPDVGATGSFVLTTGSQTITGAKTFSTAVTVTDNTASTSTSTGALIVTGGIGSGGRLNVAGNTSLEGDVALGNAGADALTINAATVTAANLPTTGASTHRIVVSNAGALVTGSVATIIGDHAWMVGGNTITGGSTTRKIGINTQASNDDALAIMTDGQDRLTISSTGNSTFTGTVTLNTGADPDLTIAEAGITRAGNIAITSSAGGVTITKGTASAIVNDDVNISRTGTSTTQAIIIDNGQLTLSSESNATPATSKVASVQISNTAPSVSIIATNAAGTSSNTFAVAPDGTSSLAALTLGDATTSGSARIHDGSGGTEGILVTSGLSADRTYTMDVDADASFVMSAGTQTIGGAKTFSAATAIEGDLTLGTGTSATGGSIILNDDAIGNSFTATVKAANHAASRTYTLDDISADASFVMTAGAQTIGGAKTFSGAASFGSTLEVAGATALNGNVTLGNAAADVVTITGTIAGASPLVFEGATSNAFQTTFAITDPTADRTITFPDVDGTVITTGNADDLIWKIGGNTITGASTTRKIGINTQATNADGLALMTSGTDRLTISSAGNSTFTGTVTLNTGANPDLTIDEAGITRAGAIAITSTSAGITLTKGNGSITLAGGDDVSLSRTGTSTTQSVTLDNSTLTLSSETNSGGSKSASIQISNATPSVTFAVTNAAGTSTNVVTITATATTADTDVSITATTASSSSTTGALKVSGGAGIGGNLYAGGTLNATGNTSLGGTLAVTGASSFNGNTTLGDAGADAVTVNAATVTAVNLPTDGTASHRLVLSDAGTLRTATLSTMVSGTVWLLDGNTTGATKTIGSNDANDIGLETNGTTRLTITAAGASTFSGALTSTGAFTANGAATLGDGNDNVAVNAGTGTYSIASSALNVSTAGAVSGVTTQSMSDALTITKTTNQMVLSSVGAGTATLTTASQGANRTYTIPDAGAAASFVMTEGTQTINGAKTLSSALTVSDNTGSTSTTTGALKVTGGAGIGENLFIAGTLNATGNTSLGGTLAVTGSTSMNGAVNLGDAAADVVTITGTIAGGTPLVFEGATANDHETSFAITDPTADNTITFPNVTGTVITTGNTSDLATITWLVGGNTIAGGTTTRKIGIAAQASDDDGLAIMTDGVDRLTFTAAGASTFSGALTSTGAFTANGAATLGDGNDNVAVNAGTGTYSIASSALNVSTAGAVSGVTTQSMSDALTITKTTNQMVLSSVGAGTATLTTASQGANRTYTIPDAGAAASFVMTEGTNTINGATNFNATASFTSALRFPFTRNITAGAYTVTANDFVVIQTVNGAINLPAGANGRMLILKSTAAGVNINITPNGTETCDAATLAEGASITIIFNGTNWYQVGN